jgi:hypothetical protein
MYSFWIVIYSFFNEINQFSPYVFAIILLPLYIIVTIYIMIFIMISVELVYNFYSKCMKTKRYGDEKYLSIYLPIYLTFYLSIYV